MHKIGLKSLQEYSVDDINRRHFKMQIFLAFKGLKLYRDNGSVNERLCAMKHHTVSELKSASSVSNPDLRLGGHSQSETKFSNFSLAFT